MKKAMVFLMFAVLLTGFVFIANAYAAKKSLETELADPSEIKGTYTVILYGDAQYEGLETTAFLDFEGDDYTLEPYAPEFQYKTENGLQAAEAIKKAEKFVSRHQDFSRFQWAKILNNNGKTIGYELKPLYHPLSYGMSDVTIVTYYQKNGKIEIRIRLESSIEQQLHNNGNDKPESGIILHQANKDFKHLILFK
jgi:ribosomal protein L31E